MSIIRLSATVALVVDVSCVCLSALQPSGLASLPSSAPAPALPLSSGSGACSPETADVRQAGASSEVSSSTALSSAVPLLPANPLERGSHELQDWLKQINLLDTPEGGEETSLCLEQEEHEAEEAPEATDGNLEKEKRNTGAQGGGVYEKDAQEGQAEGLAETKDPSKGVRKESFRWVLFVFLGWAYSFLCGTPEFTEVAGIAIWRPGKSRSAECQAALLAGQLRQLIDVVWGVAEARSKPCCEGSTGISPRHAGKPAGYGIELQQGLVIQGQENEPPGSA